MLIKYEIMSNLKMNHTKGEKVRRTIQSRLGSFHIAKRYNWTVSSRRTFGSFVRSLPGIREMIRVKIWLRSWRWLGRRGTYAHSHDLVLRQLALSSTLAFTALKRGAAVFMLALSVPVSENQRAIIFCFTAIPREKVADNTRCQGSFHFHSLCQN